MTRCSRRSAAGPLLLFLLLTATNAIAATAESELARIPVQEGGRVKPFDTWARGILHGVCGRESWDGRTASAVCFALMREPDVWKQEPFIRVDLLALKERFSLDARRKYFSFAELRENEELLTLARELHEDGREDLTRLEVGVVEVHTKLLIVDMVTRGLLPHVVPAPGVRGSRGSRSES